MSGLTISAALRRVAQLFVAVVATMLLAPTSTASAVQASDEPCTTTATVTWVTDLPTLSVVGAVVDVPGCPDGAQVGIEVITEDSGTTATTIDEVIDQQAEFDLTSLGLGIEPTVGVRILLYGDDGDPVPVDVDPDSGDGLPGTGSTLSPLIVIAAALLAMVGTVLVGLARQKRVGRGGS